MVESGNVFRIPHFLIAGSREALLREMLRNNLKDGKQYQYFDISFDGSKWTVWFYRVLETKAAMSIEALRKAGK